MKKQNLRPVTFDDNDRVWTGIVIVEPPLREARGLMSKALREVFGRQRHRTAPHYINYNPPNSITNYAYYDLTATYPQVQKLALAVKRFSRAAGWETQGGHAWVPIDTYLDTDVTEDASDADLAAMGLYRR
jgi:hypothetical protein